MKKIILFSLPGEKVMDKILEHLFPKEFKKKHFAYMPSDGDNTREKYTEFWRSLAIDNNAKFQYIDNSKRGKDANKEAEKIRKSNVLLISGGNTFTLLKHLRESGLDDVIVEYAQKKNFILAGFSAGALILGPTIEIAGHERLCGDLNEVGLCDLTGLKIINFEIVPHYQKSFEEDYLKYKSCSKHKVKRLSDEDFFIIDV